MIVWWNLFFFLDAKRPCPGYEDTRDFIPWRNEDHYKASPWKTCFCLPWYVLYFIFEYYLIPPCHTHSRNMYSLFLHNFPPMLKHWKRLMVSWQFSLLLRCHRPLLLWTNSQKRVRRKDISFKADPEYSGGASSRLNENVRDSVTMKERNRVKCPSRNAEGTYMSFFNGCQLNVK